MSGRLDIICSHENLDNRARVKPSAASSQVRTIEPRIVLAEKAAREVVSWSYGSDRP